MIYNSIEEMLATTSGLELVSDRRVTDGTVSVNGGEWFKFKTATAYNMYACGRGWVNFANNNVGGLKVNFRQQFLMRLYREEGSIGIADNHFVRIRWDGYTMYRNYYRVDEEYNLIFDLVICDTNDIILNIVHYPTVYNDGENRLEAENTVEFSPFDSSQYTFLHQDDEGNTFSVVSGIQEVFNNYYKIKYDGSDSYGTMPYQRVPVNVPVELSMNTFTKGGCAFLGWDTSSTAQNVVYTDGQSVTDLIGGSQAIQLYAVWQIIWGWIVGDANGKFYGKGPNETMVEIQGVSSLSANVFKEYGFQYDPPANQLKNLSSPVVYKWSMNSLPTFTVRVSALPHVPQLVVYQGLTLEYDIDAVVILDSGDNVLWNVSFDDGVTWKKYDGTDWLTVTIDGDGCTDGYLEMPTPYEWKQQVSGGDTIKFRAWISENGWIKEVRIDYVEE